MANLILAGAVYSFDNKLLRPRYTGEFNIVDCEEYEKEEDIKKNYDEDDSESFIYSSEYLIYDKEKYYRTQYQGYGTDRMELLSDLSKLYYFDEETEF